MRDLSNLTFDGAAGRVVTRDGEPWFVAVDVCAALGIGNPSDAARRLDDDERSLVSIEGMSRRIDDDERGMHSTHTAGGQQQTATVNESGRYSLILGSRKPEAKRFRSGWVEWPVVGKPGAVAAKTGDTCTC